MAEASHIVPFRTFVIVWALRLVLTATTVAVSRLHLGPLHIWAALAIATLKSALVVFYFMHLKYERPVFKFFLVITLVMLAIFIGMTFTDVLYR